MFALLAPKLVTSVYYQEEIYMSETQNLKENKPINKSVHLRKRYLTEDCANGHRFVYVENTTPLCPECVKEQYVELKEEYKKVCANVESLSRNLQTAVDKIARRHAGEWIKKINSESQMKIDLTEALDVPTLENLLSYFIVEKIMDYKEDSANEFQGIDVSIFMHEFRAAYHEYLNNLKDGSKYWRISDCNRSGTISYDYSCLASSELPVAAIAAAIISTLNDNI